MKKLYFLLLLASFQGFGQGNSKQISSLTAMSVFFNQYEGATDVCWVQDEKQTKVYFSWNNELVIINYNNEGYPTSTRKTYTVEKLDRPFTDLLKREIGTKHDIDYITEYVRETNLVYEVSMTNDKEWLILRLNRDKTSGALEITGKQTFNK